MTDKEKVIKGLECHTEGNCIECPYRDGWHTCPFCETLLADALNLLKEQEAVVRCKDCFNCVKEPNGELYCDILAVGYEPLGSKKVTAEWFCADGKRR